jgi:hypothetical protein
MIVVVAYRYSITGPTPTPASAAYLYFPQHPEGPYDHLHHNRCSR